MASSTAKLSQDRKCLLTAMSNRPGRDVYRDRRVKFTNDDAPNFLARHRQAKAMCDKSELMVE